MGLDKTYIHIPRSTLVTLQERCRTIGVALIAIDEDRRIVWPALQDGVREPVDSASGGRAIPLPPRAELASLLLAIEPATMVRPFRLGPAHLAVPLVISDRRRPVGTLLAVTTHPDAVPADGQGDSLPPPVPALMLESVVSSWLGDLRAIQGSQSELATLSQQLCNTYEEIKLLHKVGHGMDVVRHPRRFLQLVCQELLEVLPFRWIGVRLMPGTELAMLLGDTFVVEGLPAEDQERACGAITAFLAELKDTDARIFNEGDASDLPDPVRSLGRSLLIHPLVRGNQIYGAVIGVDKHGADARINTIDINLVDTTVASVKVFLDNAALYQDQHRMFLGTLEALTASIDAKDAYTCGHSRRVALLSQKIGAAAGLHEERVRRVHIAGLVHDVGKIGIPESVLCKPGRLTDEEFEIIKTHPDIGARILRDIPHFEDVIPGVLHHHERYDGKGYPAGLTGNSIPEFGRIIAVADSFDAMSSTRTYRSALHRARVLDEMRRCAGTQFDPIFVESFLSIDLDGYDEMYEWDRGSIAHSQAKTSKAA